MAADPYALMLRRDDAGINGYYTFLTMVMNIARTSAPDVGDAALPAL